ncbi:MAG: hypothetical protein IK062_00305 [Selenomonadaceae bacterium]|nr:hypothetical protein [Selenomonadaceae bacterium]
MQYTIHRALSMIKTTKARIEKEIYNENTAWVRVARGQDDNISGVSIKEIKRDIQSHYDRVIALIENYIKLKSAVIKSNAGIRSNTEIFKTKVAEKSLTIAEIIDLQDVVYGKTKKTGFKSMLLEKMKEDYAEAQREFDNMQMKADDEVNQYINSISGRKKDNEETDAATKSLIEATSKMLHEQKDPCLIDPLKIAEKIIALENELENFRTEADSVLSEQNALTTIEIDLTEIK